MPADNRPNILLIMTDQQRGDALGADGHPVLETPNLDQLAEMGTRFTRAYTTCPSCVPARRAFLSGQFPATNGMVAMGGGPGSWNPAHTLPGELTKAGYQTELVGRTMHQPPTRKRFGYEHMLLGSSHLPDDDYARFMDRSSEPVDGFFSHGLDFNGWTARPWHMEEHKHPTNWIMDQSLRFLETRDPSCPFFLTVSTYAPHPPLCPPPFYMDRYLRQELPTPVIGDWTETPPNGGSARVDAARDVVLQGERLRSAQAGYFGLINHIDDQIHRILKARGLAGYDAKNTVVIFTSDHGEMLGDHCMFRKCEPYEGSARVPLVIAGGSDTGLTRNQVIDEPVCLEDLMPTLLELAGHPVPETVDGRSLVPLLRGETPAWRDLLHMEHGPTYSQPQAFHALTDGRWKYIWRPFLGTEQLFDLTTDPMECHDRAAESADLPKWRARLVQQLRDRPEGFTDGETLQTVDAYPHLLPFARDEA